MMTPVSRISDGALANTSSSNSDRAEYSHPSNPNLCAKCFTVADRWFQRFSKLGSALHRGFWLGCLAPDDLNAITAGQYADSQSLTSLEYMRGGFFDWENTLVHRYFHPGSRILVAAAGTGREILALRSAGLDADGFECNTNLLGAGQKIFAQLGEAYSVTLCAPDRVPSGSVTYDGLLVGWGGYMHIPTSRRRIQFLRALRDRAQPHSPLLLSFFTRAAESSRCDLIAYRVARICRTLRLAPKNDSVELGDDLDAGQYVHRFTRDELQAELGDAGFELAHYQQGSGSGMAVCFARELSAADEPRS